MAENPLKKPRLPKTEDQEKILTPKKPKPIKPKSEKVSHELPKPRKQRVSYGNRAPRTEFQKQKARENLAKAREKLKGLPRTEAQKAAAIANLKKAQQAAAKRPRTQKQIEAAKRNIAKYNEKRRLAKAQEQRIEPVDIPDISFDVIQTFEAWLMKFDTDEFRGRAYIDSHVTNTWHAYGMSESEYAQLLEKIENESEFGFDFQLAKYEDYAADVFSRAIITYFQGIYEKTGKMPDTEPLTDMFRYELDEDNWDEFITDSLYENLTGQKSVAGRSEVSAGFEDTTKKKR